MWQQALKEKGGKKGETILSAALLSRTAVAALLPHPPPHPQHCACTPGAGSRGGGMATGTPGACSVLAWMHCGGCTIPPSPCPWLCWDLALWTTALPETCCCKATALGFWLSAEGFP